MDGKKMLQVLFFVLTIFVIQNESKCQNQTLNATTLSQSFSYFNYEDNENCLLSLRPSDLDSNSTKYYLQIVWNTFEIEGNMSDCSNDSVEVYLTKHFKTIGKYCSSNLGKEKLFNMYSSDGYASIRFKSDASGRKKGFQFTYQLKSYNNSYLKNYGMDMCYYDAETSYYGIFYPSGWPKGYTKASQGYISCYHEFRVAKGKGFRIAIMDLDLRSIHSTCDAQNDYFQVKASSTSLTSVTSILSATSLTSKLCWEYHPGYVRVISHSDIYVYLYFNKPLGSYPSHSNRGFMVGYIFYDPMQQTSLTTARPRYTLSDAPKKELKTAKVSAGKKKEASKASALWGAGVILTWFCCRFVEL